jgi:hypothetical protein
LSALQVAGLPSSTQRDQTSDSDWTTSQERYTILWQCRLSCCLGCPRGSFQTMAVVSSLSSTHPLGKAVSEQLKTVGEHFHPTNQEVSESKDNGPLRLKPRQGSCEKTMYSTVRVTCIFPRPGLVTDQRRTESSRSRVWEPVSLVSRQQLVQIPIYPTVSTAQHYRLWPKRRNKPMGTTC